MAGLSTEEKIEIENAVRALWPEAPEKLTKQSVFDRIKGLHPYTHARSNMRYEELVPYLETANQWVAEQADATRKREHHAALDAIYPRRSIRGNAGGPDGWQHDFLVKVGWSLANTFQRITSFIQDVMYVKGLCERYEALHAAKGQTLEDGSVVTQEDINDALWELLCQINMLREPNFAVPDSWDFTKWAEGEKAAREAARSAREAKGST